MADFTEVRAILQSHTPNGLSLAVVRKVRVKLNVYLWTATYHHVDDRFPAPDDFPVEEAKSIFQSCSPARYNVSTVTTEETSSGRTYWAVDYKERRERLVLGDFIPTTIIKKTDSSPRIVTNPPAPVSIIKEEKKRSSPRKARGIKRRSLNGVDKVRIKEDDAIRTIPLSEYKTSMHPQKVYSSDNTDLTRKIFGKTRVVKGLLHSLLNMPLIPFVKSKNEPKSGNQESDCGRAEAPKSGRDCSPTDYTQCAFNYSNLERQVQMSKLRDPRTLRAAREYIASQRIGLPAGLPPLLSIKGSPIFERKLLLKLDGLPADEGLFELYLDFARSLDQSEPVIRAELESLYKTLQATK